MSAPLDSATSAPTVVSAAQIGAQLDAVLQRDSDAAAVAIRAAVKGGWPEVIERGGRQFQVRWCESRLALRQALAELEPQGTSHGEAEGAPPRGLVLMTPLRDAEIPDDVAARLARCRVFQPKGWDILRQMFAAREVDVRLGRHEWLPDVLVDSAHLGDFAPVAGGFLDLDTAWREVLSRCLGLEAARPDAATLMRWATRTDLPVLMAKLPPKAREDVMGWLGSHAGPAGRLVVCCIEAGRAADAAPLGVVCGVLFGLGAEGHAELAQAAVRLERFVADQHVSVQDGREWALQARRLLDHAPPEETRAILDRADALMNELRVANLAYVSADLPSGLEQRLELFAQALSAQSAAPSDERARSVEGMGQAVLSHRLAELQPLRAERVRMARRLARWLMRGAAGDAGLEHHVAAHADDGAFVDWARYKLLGGDELPALSAAYAGLRSAVALRREALNRAFAASLAPSLKEAGPLGPRTLPVEHVLQHLVGPLAAAHPVLLLVVDGLSVSIFRELFERPERQGWVELAPESLGRPLLGLAAFPTVTEVSRASLLCGKITTGAAPAEKQAFARHEAMLAASGKDHPPKLFHKGELSDGGSLATGVRAALAQTAQRVVGVVYNAVDDHLGGPDQLHQRWDLEQLRGLLPLLREARDSRRIVVVTADHGHVLEDGSALVANGAVGAGRASDRWRAGSQAADPKEVALAGDRVLTPEGARQVVCLWSEAARYTGRKNGYHGGAAPAEAIVPLSVFAPSGVNVPGWLPAPPQQPDWWEQPANLPMVEAKASKAPRVSGAPGGAGEAKAPDAPKAPRAPSKRASAAQPGQGGLFGELESEPAVPAPAAAGLRGAGADDWVAAMLDSPLYASQRQLAARVALPDDQMRRLLEALHERGGKLTRGALAQRMAVPELRLNGLLSAARRVLNIDQAAVLTVDEASGTVELNRGLMQQQFRITTVGGGR